MAEQEAGRGERDGSTVEEAVAASRRLYPELWEKADEVARIIDPGAFATWYDSTTCPDPQPVGPSVRVKAKRSAALRKAWEILRYLGEAPEETDWLAIFDEMDNTRAEDEAMRNPHPRGRR